MSTVGDELEPQRKRRSKATDTAADSAAANVIPGNPVALHLVAKQLGKATHVLVEAAARGKFPPIFPVGDVWHVSRDAVVAWCTRNHAVVTATAAQRERIRQAGADEDGQQPRHLRGQPRADTASSS